jgi:hypothetical protein
MAHLESSAGGGGGGSSGGASTSDRGQSGKLSSTAHTKRHFPFFAVEPDEESCAVCFSGVTYEGENNEILFCDGCDGAFHQQCYGVDKLPAEDEKWYCEECKNNCDKKELCVICLQGGSGKKRTDQGTWAHVSCAYEIPECYFGDIEHVDEIKGVEKILKARFGTLQCILCHQRHGAKVQCAAKHCTAAFHPRCALKVSGKFIDQEEDPDERAVIGKCCDQSRTATGEVFSWWSWYCRKHLALRKEGELDIPIPKWEEVKLKEEKRAEKERQREERRKEKEEQKAQKLRERTEKAAKREQERKEKERQRKEKERQRRKAAEGRSAMKALKKAENRINESASGCQREAPPKLLTHYGLSKEERYHRKRQKRLCHHPDCGMYKIRYSNFCRMHTLDHVNTAGSPAVTLERAHSSVQANGRGPQGSVQPVKKRRGRPKGAKDLKKRKRRNNSFSEGDLSSIVDDVSPRKAEAEVESDIEFDEDKSFRCEQTVTVNLPDDDFVFDEDETWFNTVTPVNAKRKKDRMCSGRFWHIIRDFFEPLGEPRYQMLLSRVQGGKPFAQPRGWKALRRTASRDNAEESAEVAGPSLSLEDRTGRVSALFGNPASVDVAAQFERDGDTLQLVSYNAISNSAAGGNLSRVEENGGFSRKAGEGLVNKDLPKLEKELKLLREKNSSVYETILNRIDGVDGGKAVRLGGEGDVAPDGNLRYPGLASKDDITSIPLIQGHEELKEEQELIARFQNLSAWREVSQALARGYADQKHGFNLEKEDDILLQSLKARGDSRAEEEVNEEDDVVCQVCFDGKSTEMNPILMCDRCNMAIHQRCYGVIEIPDGSFFCSRCEYLNGFTKKQQKVVFRRTCCRICGGKDGALKRAEGGAWVHLFCAQWSSGVRIQNVMQMTSIKLGPRLSKRACPPCSVCQKSCGPVISCSHPGCNVEYHPYCAWYAGHHMTAAANTKILPSDDATDFISFKSFCPEHTPGTAGKDSDSALQRVALQIEIREKYRSKFPRDTFIRDRKQTGKTRRKRTTGDRERMLAMQRLAAVKSAAAGDTGSKRYLEPLEPDPYRSDVCSVCFIKYPDDKLITCKDCKVKVHADCYGPVESEVDSEEFRCDLCIELKSIEPSDRPKIKCAVCPRSGGAYKKTTRGKWVHAFCAYWVPSCLWTDDQAINISGIHKSCFESRCTICRRGGKTMMGEGACCQCSHPGCYKTYHPLCAKFSDCYSHYVKRPEGFERVSYCPSHTPANMVLNKELGIWIKAVSRRPLPMGLRELLVIRKDFDRARTLVDLVRKRAKIARRVFELEHEVFEGKRVEYEPKAGPMARRTRKELQADKINREKKGKECASPVKSVANLQEANSLKFSKEGRASVGSGSQPNTPLDNRKKRKREKLSPKPKDKPLLSQSPGGKKEGLNFPGAGKISANGDFDACMTPERAHDMKLMIMQKLLVKRSKDQRLIELDAKLDYIYKSIDATTDPNGVDISDWFQHVPSEEEVPGYHDSVQNPISMLMIRNKIQNGEYSSLNNMFTDFRLLVKNAKQFNELDSDVYRYACVLMANINKLAANAQTQDLSSPKVVRKRQNQQRTLKSGPPCHLCKKSTRKYHTELVRPEGEVMCEECIRTVSLKEGFAGRELFVYWPNDKQWYQGKVNCYDNDSGRHRVLYYVDCDWEFVDFTNSPVVFLPALYTCIV